MTYKRRSDKGSIKKYSPFVPLDLAFDGVFALGVFELEGVLAGNGVLALDDFLEDFLADSITFWAAIQNKVNERISKFRTNFN